MTEVLYLPYERLLLAVLVGLFCGVFYELLRAVRLIISEKSRLVNFIIDMLFFIILSFVIFFFSLMIGDGRIRLYYFAGLFTGVLLYLFTIGKLVYLINKSFVRLIKKLLKKLIKPLKQLFVAVAHKTSGLFGRIYDFSKTKVKNSVKHLPKRKALVYNNTVAFNAQSTGDIAEGSEQRNAVKGRIKTTRG